ncbi:MAG TPA: hypothetical protein VIH35_01295 [Kiritimatiellia bacterium]|jgi:hypothetical protein
MTQPSTRLRPAFAAVLGVAMALCLVACSGGEGESGEGGHGEGHGAAPHVAPPNPADLAPKIYPEPEWQERFAHWYKEYYGMFQPINEGLRIRVSLEGNGDVTGTYMGLTNETTIMMLTPNGFTNFAPAVLTETTRERLLVTEFAAINAKREVEAERAAGTKPPVADTMADAPVAEVIEKRFAATEGTGLDFRMGPGKHFKTVNGALLQKGELIPVLEERSGWIRFRAATTNPEPITVWVNKFATLPQLDVNPETQERDIKALQDSGVILEFIPSNNIARVDVDIWNEMDFLVRQGIGRSLAFYCGAKRGTGLNWVEFRDVRSGKRIAKFSESQGLKIYNL